MKILLVTDKYYPKPYANAVCAQNLIDEFIRKGHSVDVLAHTDSGIETPTTWNGANVYTIKPDLRLQLFYYSDNFVGRKSKLARFVASFFSKTRKLFLISWIPFYSFSFPRRIKKMIGKLHEKNKYELIITMFQPFDGVYGMYLLKKSGLEIPWVIYSVDRVVGIDSIPKPLKKLGRPYYWEKKFIEKADAFFYMESRKQHYQAKCFEHYHDKLHIADIPVPLGADIEKEHMGKKVPYDFKTNAENWVYTGSLGGAGYNPEALLKFWNGMPKDKKRVLHFFGRGKGMDELREKTRNMNGQIIVHDYVDSETFLLVQQAADVFVGLRTIGQISLKIFEYMSFGKPIIHFSGHINDPCKDYVMKYPRGIVIETYKGNVDDWLESYEQQKSSFDMTCDGEKIKQIFYKNTPEYNCAEILKVLEKN